jgi:D-amino-acid dehydrogenase
MKIVVLGAGIAGITAAYSLGTRGHDVTVIDQESAPALQTSFANGGQLSYTHAEPWANPHVFPKLFKWMFQDDAPLVLRFSSDPHMIRWGLKFMSNCMPEKARKNCERMLRIGLYSRDKMKEIREDTKLDFAFKATGILHIYTNQKDFDAGVKQAEFQKSLGLDYEYETLDREGTLEKETALKQSTKDIAGSIYSPQDESGDIHIFTQKLASWCEEHHGTTLKFNTPIMRLIEEKGKLVSIVTSEGEMKADAFVLATGPQSPLFLRKLGINLPIYPMKGYSVTVPAWENAPITSVTDDEKKIVFSRLGDHVRAAGTAEFARYNTDIREARITPILDCMKRLFPDADTSEPQKWACLRPQTPDGPPIIGKTDVENLYLHTGHGTLGWTQSAGTAAALADIIEDKEPEISLDGLTAERYS